MTAKRSKTGLLREHVCRRALQSSTDRQDRLDPNIALTALDPPNVVPMKAGAVGEILLAQSSLQPQRPEARADISQLRVNFHPPDLRHSRGLNYTLSV